MSMFLAIIITKADNRHDDANCNWREAFKDGPCSQESIYKHEQ